MKSMNTKKLALTLGAITIAAVSAIAAVGSGYTFFGGATYVMPGNASNRAVQLVSSGTVPFSGIDFAVPSTLTFANLQNLATDYKVTAGDCGLGAPRFQVNVLDPNTNTVKNIFVYIGPPPNYNGCPSNLWTNTGNLMAPANLIDTSQVGGSFYQPVAVAKAAYGNYQVVGIQLVVDNGGITVQIDNTQINDTTYTYEPNSKDDCKDGGWQNFTSAPGPFKNQGQCVSYFASNGKGNH